MSLNDVYIIGASGHGKVIASTLHTTGIKIAGFFDDDTNKHNSLFFGIPILGNLDSFLSKMDKKVIFGIGNPNARENIASLITRDFFINAIHAKSIIDESVKIGEGTVIFAGAIIQPDTKIGRHCIINTGATVDHDCKLSDFVHVCPGSHLAGGIEVGSKTWIGIGSSIKQGVKICSDVIIGAGATVIRDIEEPGTYVGCPARKIN